MKKNIAIDKTIVERGIRQPIGLRILNNWIKFTFSEESKRKRKTIVITLIAVGFPIFSYFFLSWINVKKNKINSNNTSHFIVSLSKENGKITRRTRRKSSMSLFGLNVTIISPF
jgi:hypothetical protein